MDKLSRPVRKTAQRLRQRDHIDINSIDDQVFIAPEDFQRALRDHSVDDTLSTTSRACSTREVSVATQSSIDDNFRRQESVSSATTYQPEDSTDHAEEKNAEGDGVKAGACNNSPGGELYRNIWCSPNNGARTFVTSAIEHGHDETPTHASVLPQSEENGQDEDSPRPFERATSEPVGTAATFHQQIVSSDLDRKQLSSPPSPPPSPVPPRRRSFALLDLLGVLCCAVVVFYLYSNTTCKAALAPPFVLPQGGNNVFELVWPDWTSTSDVSGGKAAITEDLFEAADQRLHQFWRATHDFPDLPPKLVKDAEANSRKWNVTIGRGLTLRNSIRSRALDIAQRRQSYARTIIRYLEPPTRWSLGWSCAFTWPYTPSRAVQKRIRDEFDSFARRVIRDVDAVLVMIDELLMVVNEMLRSLIGPNAGEQILFDIHDRAVESYGSALELNYSSTASRIIAGGSNATLIYHPPDGNRSLIDVTELASKFDTLCKHAGPELQRQCQFWYHILGTRGLYAQLKDLQARLQQLQAWGRAVRKQFEVVVEGMRSEFDIASTKGGYDLYDMLRNPDSQFWSSIFFNAQTFLDADGSMTPAAGRGWGASQ